MSLLILDFSGGTGPGFGRGWLPCFFISLLLLLSLPQLLSLPNFLFGLPRFFTLTGNPLLCSPWICSPAKFIWEILCRALVSSPARVVPPPPLSPLRLAIPSCSSVPTVLFVGFHELPSVNRLRSLGCRLFLQKLCGCALVGWRWHL